MKVCLVAHGYPPELVGGTENSVRALAHGLARAGDEVLVVAGSMQHEQGFRTSEEQDGDVRVVRIHRADLYFDHWQKSASARVEEAFRELLRRERPDVVHVNHWIRLSRDLVVAAAREGIGAAATLHDLWTTCLITFRVRPGTRELCEAPLAASPCLRCAAGVPPRTPWVPLENQHLALAEHRGDLVRELALARAVVVPSRAHADAVERFLGVGPELAVRVLPHGRDLDLSRRTPLAPPEDSGRLVLGAWGHLHPLKGQDLLLEAVRRLPEPGRVVLHLAGDEPDAAFAARLDELADGLDVHRHGAFAVEELDRHPVSEVHAMVSGTRAHESWGLVLDEALALGLPMVLPARGAYAERLPGEGAGALLYEPGDAGSLAAALARVLEEPGLLARLRAALPALADAVPTVARHVAELRDLYQEVAAAGAPEPPADDWWRARMQKEAERAWDESLARTPPEELGLG